MTQHILEEDDDEIPLIELEFGKEGKPLYIAGPYDDQAMINRVIATLDKHAGEGNYDVIFTDDDEWDDEGDEDWEDDDQWDKDRPELFYPGEIREIMEGEKQPNLSQALTLSSATYIGQQGYSEQPLDIKKMEIDAEMVDEEFEYYIDDDLDEAIMDAIDRYQETDFKDQEEERAYLLNLIQQEPDNPFAYFQQHSLLIKEGNDTEVDKAGEALFLRFPDFLYFRFIRAFSVLKFEDAGKGVALLGGTPYLHESFPHRKVFSRTENLIFRASWGYYYLINGDIRASIDCLNDILYELDGHPISQYVSGELVYRISTELMQNGAAED